MRAFVAGIALCASLSAAVPAMADDSQVPAALPGMEQMLRGMVREGDVSVLFSFLRESLAAAIEGREPPPVPRELTGRAEELAQSLRVQGALAAFALLEVLEQRAKEALRDMPPPRPTLPPTRPSTPL